MRVGSQISDISPAHEDKTKVHVKKKGQKYGEGYVDDDGQRIKAQGFRFFGFFDRHEKQNNKGSYNQKQIHNLRPQRFQQNLKKRRLGFISGKDIFGNNRRGQDWINEQKRRHQGGDNYDSKKQVQEKDFDDDDQVIYIEASLAEKRLKQLRRLGRAFYDEDFPPNQYSLWGPYGPIKEWYPIKWGKISSLFSRQSIFRDIVEPSDIKQGYLGDCYFLAGLAALAQRPDRIFQLFLLTQVNDMKYYSVKMIYRGKWRTIDLDESIPILNKQPVFSKSNSEQLWVIILEKAWAKLYGSYKQLQGGFPEEPLHDLTGAPIKYIFFQRISPGAQQQWRYLQQASLKQYAMVASSPPGYDSDKSPTGIFQGHAYTFLNATYIEYDGGKKERIVQLRNPWGQGQFKGRWSDQDPVWNSVSYSQKNRVGFKRNSDDGMFFMTFNDFIHEFRNIAVAQINDNASYVYESFIDRHCQGVFFAIKVKISSTYSLQVDKTPERSFTGQAQNRYKYPSSCLELARLQQRRVVKFQGYISKRRTLYRSFQLEPGLYIAWVKTDFDPNFEKDFQVNLAVYGEYACKIRLATRQEAIKFSNDPRIKWQGQKNSSRSNFLNTYSKSPKNSYESISFNQNNVSSRSIHEENKMPKKQYPNSIIGHNQRGSNSLQLANNKLVVSNKDKKVRKIETQHTKVETIQENQEGEALIKIQDNQLRKQSVTLKGNTKTKSTQSKKQSIQTQYEGEVISKKQKFVQTITLKQQKQDGKIIQKISTKERQTEIIQEDDDGTGSSLLSLKQQTQYRQSLPYSKERSRQGAQNNANIDNQFSSIRNYNPSHFKQSSIKKDERKKYAVNNPASKELMDERIYNNSDFHDRNIIRCVEIDSQQEGTVKTSFLNIN